MILLLAAGAAPGPACATILTVPDEVPSIQEALDGGVDTVLIRPGDYSETAVVSRPGILLMGASGDTADLPTVAGLRIAIYPSDLYPAVYAFQGLRFVSRVVYLNVRNNADISFAQCHLGGGMVDSSGFGDTGNIAFSKCRLEGLLDLIAKGRIELDSCQVAGHLVAGVSPSAVVVRGCTFQGEGEHRSYSAIRSEGHSGCHILGNTIRGYVTGIYANGDDAVLSNNVVEDCSYLGIDVGHANIIVADNAVRRCGYGIHTESSGSVVITRNTIMNVGGNGIDVGSDTDLIGNLIWRCGGDGVRAANYVRARQNTSCFNGGSGYVSGSDPYQPKQEWVGNVGYANNAYGILWLVGETATFRCNDWFGNRMGDVMGRSPSSDDFSLDPQFCEADSGDFGLNSTSPLVGDSACGQIGALGVGCGVTATLVQRFTAARASNGIRVVWEVAEDATASEIWLERSEEMEGGAWIRPATDRSTDNRAMVELDRSAALDRMYWYRLVALEGSVVTVIGPPIVVEAQARLEFRLVEVGPNPGSGPVRIAFALEHAAAIEIDVFDVQGRRVASPGRGVWPAGTHMVEWNGLTRNGEAAPSGLYLLRYGYPGGQDRRRIVRVP